MDRVELLAPAGSREAFIGALNAGADAVYLGGPDFGARAYAENFTVEELVRTIKEAHVFNVKIYLTVNTLTREAEMHDLVEMVRVFYDAGLDGVIVQDLGVMKALYDNFPGLLLHASTQLSVSCAESAAFLKRLGVSRVVPARELSLNEIRSIREKESIEIESFIHGAMCYSYSGRCLMSSFLGGRSGNRGRCAGPCRLPYEVLDSEHAQASCDGSFYPLSMKDMCVLEILPDLIDAGIASFKIEGRMKRPEYASGTTAIYRKYIDRFYEWDAKGRPTKWSIDKEDLKDLLSLYIRADLSTGYYYERNGRDMMTIGKGGYAGADENLLLSIKEKYLTSCKKCHITGYASIIPGNNASLTVSLCDGDEEITVTAVGENVDKASNRPVTSEDIEKKLRKTGDTCFDFEELEVCTDGNAFIPVGALNKLRRDALAVLDDRIQENYIKKNRKTFPLDTSVRKRTGGDSVPSGLWVSVMTGEQLSAAMDSDAAAVIIDGPLVEDFFFENTAESVPDLEKKPVFAALPYVFRESDRRKADVIYENCYRKIKGFLIKTPEEIEFLLKKYYDGVVIADSTLYHWNKNSALILKRYCDKMVLPLELSGKEEEGTFGNDPDRSQILMVYGRIPMMVSANCVRKTTQRCTHSEKGFWYIKDRMNAVFPVRTVCGFCHNVIYNSVPLSIHKYYRDKLFCTADKLCVFTDENADEARKILDAYCILTDVSAKDKVKADASDNLSDILGKGYTTGHYRKGAQ